MKINRLFVPLSRDPYNWLNNGSKKWELRRYGRQYTHKNIRVGRLVEFRFGYSDPSKAIWAIITDVNIYESLVNLYDKIPYKDILPEAISQVDAITYSKEILNLEKYPHTEKFIAFQVSKIRNPMFIEMSNEFYNSILSKDKVTTIRRGKREYKTGPAIIYFEHSNILVEIKQVVHKLLHEINHEDLKKEGYESIIQLKKTLVSFYNDIKDDEIFTIVEFEVSESEVIRHVDKSSLR